MVYTQVAQGAAMLRDMVNRAWIDGGMPRAVMTLYLWPLLIQPIILKREVRLLADDSEVACHAKDGRLSASQGSMCHRKTG